MEIHYQKRESLKVCINGQLDEISLPILDFYHNNLNKDLFYFHRCQNHDMFGIEILFPKLVRLHNDYMQRINGVYLNQLNLKSQKSLTSFLTQCI